jgi:Domain of unknown function (DUF3943)
MARVASVMCAALVSTVALQPCVADEPKAHSDSQNEAPTAFAAPPPRPGLEWGTGDAKSYLVPAYEIPAFQFLLNRFDHYTSDASTYPSPISNLGDNLHRKWVVDNDKFSTNQFLHPYQGSIYQGLARSAGLDFWEASAYTFMGSLLWEEAGESTSPSINDQIASGIGGNFLGEPLFRLASLLLETGSSGRPGLWRELGAAIISPPLGFNRLVYGKRFDPVFRSYNPAVFTRVDLSAILSSHFSSNVRLNPNLTVPATTQTYESGTASASFTAGYGLPGKPDYSYDRPFDYFNFELTLDNINGVESLFSRGLLFGKDYDIGASYRGIWGVYGLYDYVAPTIFRVSSTGGGIGTTAQSFLSHSLVLQGTALGGVGYAAGGVIHGSGVTAPGPMGEGQRNYHYGVAPQAMLATRLIWGDRAALDSTVRLYYISRFGATESTGSETINRVDLALTVRVHDLHAITVRYAESSRDGRYAQRPDSHQRVATFSIGYTLLGSTRLGAVDWRAPEARVAQD